MDGQEQAQGAGGAGRWVRGGDGAQEMRGAPRDVPKERRVRNASSRASATYDSLALSSALHIGYHVCVCVRERERERE